VVICDKQAEAGVIATVLVHPEFIHNLSNVRPRYFSDMTNKCIYWAVQELVKSGVENIDAFNIINMLDSDRSVSEQMKGYDVDSIQMIIDNCEDAARDSLEELYLLADNVITTSFKRELETFSKILGRQCQNENINLDQLNEFVNKGLTQIMDRYVFGSDSVQFGEKVDKIWEDIVSKRNSDGSFGLPSVIPAFEKYFTYVPGELVLVSGATGKGKSSFFLNETIHKLKMGNGVLYIDTELSDEVFFLRCLANLSGVEYAKIQRGSYSLEEEKRIEDGKEFLRKANLIHEYLPEFNRIKIEQMCRKWQIQSDIGLVIYDYMKPEKTLGTGAAEVSNGLGQMCDFLKNIIAGSLALPVIAGAQINTTTNTLADSQKPLRYCSTYVLWREKTSEEIRQDGLDCGNYCCEIGKNRNGMSTGEGDYIDIKFDGNKMRITEAKQHAKHKDNPFDG